MRMWIVSVTMCQLHLVGVGCILGLGKLLARDIFVVIAHVLSVHSFGVCVIERWRISGYFESGLKVCDLILAF